MERLSSLPLAQIFELVSTGKVTFEEFEQFYNDVYTQGVAIGEETGYDKGYDYGYDDGHVDGRCD